MSAENTGFANNTGGIFTMDVQRRGQAAVVRIGGSAGMSEAAGMQRKLEELAAKPLETLVLDLSDLEFISSSGLGAIVAAHLKCRHHRGVIKLVNPQPPVRQILETTRLDRLFSIYPSVQQAMS